MSGLQTKNILFLFLLSLLFLNSCGGSEDDKKEESNEKEKGKKELDEKKGEVETEKKKAPVLPSSLQVASSFQKAGLPYEAGLVLDPALRKDFIERDRQNLAFGAYSADLSYLVINDKKERTVGLMTALMGLADDLNISSVFDTENIAERFQKNIDKQDSLVALIIEVQERFDTYVAKNHNRRLRTIAYAGGWTEAIYLASQVGIGDDKKLHLEVEEQMTILQKLIKALERDVKNEEGPVGELLEELRAMESSYWEDPPEPGKKIPEEMMAELKEHAERARRIITKTSS